MSRLASPALLAQCSQTRPAAITQPIQNVSDTAFMVAGFRALENERPKPLFRAPLAAKLVGDHSDALGVVEQ